MFSYQGSFTQPTKPVDRAQFFALVRATKWAEVIDKDLLVGGGDILLFGSCYHH